MTAALMYITYMHMSEKLPEDAEARFLAGYDAADYERPSVTVDVVAMTVDGPGLGALLVRRREAPQRGRWALPGGFVGLSESLDRAALRVLREKAGLRGVYLEQLYTFGAPGRDPRTRVISVSYMALVDRDRLGKVAATRDGDAVLAQLEVPWSGQAGGPVGASAGNAPLITAFDHATILGTAVKRLRGKLDYAPIGAELLLEHFTLRQLQDIHEAIRGHEINKDSFRRRMLATGWLLATGERQADVAFRPAELYRLAPPPLTAPTDTKENDDG